jgi:hypothetical protein
VPSWRDSQKRTLGSRREYRRRRQNAWLALGLFAGAVVTGLAVRVLLG